jgi:hypothetical protein
MKPSQVLQNVIGDIKYDIKTGLTLKYPYITFAFYGWAGTGNILVPKDIFFAKEYKVIKLL